MLPAAITSIPMGEIAKYADVAVFSIPALLPYALGAGANLLEHSESRPLQAIGWLGTRVCSVLTIFAGLPLIIWSLAKAALAHTINFVTFNKYDSLKNWAKLSDTQLNQVLVSLVLMTALLILVDFRKVYGGLTQGNISAVLQEEGQSVVSAIGIPDEWVQNLLGMVGMGAPNEEEEEEEVIGGAPNESGENDAPMASEQEIVQRLQAAADAHPALAPIFKHAACLKALKKKPQLLESLDNEQALTELESQPKVLELIGSPMFNMMLPNILPKLFKALKTPQAMPWGQFSLPGNGNSFGASQAYGAMSEEQQLAMAMLESQGEAGPGASFSLPGFNPEDDELAKALALSKIEK